MVKFNEQAGRRRRSITKRKGATIEEIKSIALKLFNQWGYKGTTIRDICEEIEITAPSMYYYFDSKENIFSVLMEESAQVLMDTVKTAVENTEAKTADERLQHLFDSYRSFYRDHYDQAIFLIKVRCFSEKGLDEVVSAELDKQGKWMNEQMTAYLSGSQKRRMPKTPVADILVAFDGFTTGYLLQLHQGMITDTGEQAQKSWELFWNGIK